MGITKTKPAIKADARFDARLTRAQKELFEEAARIKGFKSLSEFVIFTTQEAATMIIERDKAILVSEKDKNIFFDALANPPKPNKALIKAAKAYYKKMGTK
jgi:uncharacterized protein (DUF1778 family)